jgi:hypothetical protein
MCIAPRANGAPNVGYEAMIEDVRFAEDSPLEGNRFELSVPP